MKASGVRPSRRLHILIMDKVEIYVVLFQWGYLEKMQKMFIEYSSRFHKTFIQIVEFDFLPGRHKG